VKAITAVEVVKGGAEAVKTQKRGMTSPKVEGWGKIGHLPFFLLFPISTLSLSIQIDDNVPSSSVERPVQDHVTLDDKKSIHGRELCF
jgi:hypothetical protein